MAKQRSDAFENLPIRVEGNNNDGYSVGVHVTNPQDLPTGGGASIVEPLATRRLLVPLPPRLHVTLTPASEHGGNLPKWMDEAGVMYGNRGDVIVKSDDYWQTFTDLFTLDGKTVQLVAATKTGRVIVGTHDGEVYVSDEDGANPTLAFTFQAGYASYWWGHRVYDNVVMIASYGSKNADNPPREVYVSHDYGETFFKSFEETVFQDASQYHIHDVEFDPFSSRMWIYAGDSGSRQLYYNDKMGDPDSWVPTLSAWGGGVPPTNLTAIMAFDHGVVFGSDQVPSGLRYWKKPARHFEPAFDLEDFTNAWHPFGDNFDSLAKRTWRVESPEYRGYFIPFGALNNGVTRLLASPDGHSWYEVWRGHEPGQPGLENIMGPHPGDTERRMFAIYQNADGAHIWKAAAPDWR